MYTIFTYNIYTYTCTYIYLRCTLELQQKYRPLSGSICETSKRENFGLIVRNIAQSFECPKILSFKDKLINEIIKKFKNFLKI